MLRPLVLLSLIPYLVSSYNYLVYSPLLATSHTNYLASIADTLTIAGHNVTFFAPVVHNRLRGKFHVKHTTDIVTVEVSKELDSQFEHFVADGPLKNIWEFTGGPNVTNEYRKLIDKIGKREQWKKDLQRRKFDVFIYELLSFCGTLVQKFLKIDTLISAPSMFDDVLHNYFVAGVRSDVPATNLRHDQCDRRTFCNFDHTRYSTIISSSQPILSAPFAPFSDKMSLIDRIKNIKYYYEQPRYPEGGPVDEQAFENFGIEKFSLAEAISQSTFVFVQSNSYMDFPRPSLPKTVFIGGISTNLTAMRSQKVPKEIDEILNRRNKTVYISFGSIVLSRNMPKSDRDNLLRVIKSFPEITFLWKYEDDDVTFADGIENIFFSKRFPQTALLADPRLSAMLTHAGISSAMELAYLGVPAITVPIFCDQLRNGPMMARHGGSINVDKWDLPNFDLLRAAIRDIVYDEKYSIKAKFQSEILANQPFKPAELVVKHAEFAARFKKIPQLESASSQMSFIEYYLLDIALLSASSVVLILLTLVTIIRRLLPTVHFKFKKQ